MCSYKFSPLSQIVLQSPANAKKNPPQAKATQVKPLAVNPAKLTIASAKTKPDVKVTRTTNSGVPVTKLEYTSPTGNKFLMQFALTHRLSSNPYHNQTYKKQFDAIVQAITQVPGLLVDMIPPGKWTNIMVYDDNPAESMPPEFELPPGRPVGNFLDPSSDDPNAVNTITIPISYGNANLNKVINALANGVGNAYRSDDPSTARSPAVQKQINTFYQNSPLSKLTVSDKNNQASVIDFIDHTISVPFGQRIYPGEGILANLGKFNIELTSGPFEVSPLHTDKSPLLVWRGPGKVIKLPAARTNIGIDYTVEFGRSPAIYGGTVISANYDRGYGNTLKIQLNVKIPYDYNGDGTIGSNEYFPVIYQQAHLDSFSVSPNQRVKAGQIVGEMGNTGGSHGAHIDSSLYALLPNGQVLDIDPQAFNTYLRNLKQGKGK
jgi:murein DD-endopeptidase MepM/ murein hydrolase activator NlpD